MTKNLKALFSDDPDVLRALEAREQTTLLKELVKDKILEEVKPKTVKIEYLKGEQGEIGPEGPTGPQGEIGPQGEPGEQGPKGEDGKDGRDGESVVGPRGPAGKDGVDGVEISPEEVAEKLNTLKEAIEPSVIKGYENSDEVIKKIKKQKLEMRDIKGMPLDQRFHGGSPNSTKGDLAGFSTHLERVPVGTNGQVLVADSTASLGLKWADSIPGEGTVTSIATAGLISGGTITTTGTITTSMATNKLVGRGTAGTGVMEEITLGTNISLSGTTLNVPTGAGGVSSITGTANQVIASAAVGAVTLSLPQSIGTASAVQFGSLTVGNGSVAAPSLNFTGSTNTGFYYSSGSTELHVIVGGADGPYWDSNRNYRLNGKYIESGSSAYLIGNGTSIWDFRGSSFTAWTGLVGVGALSIGSSPSGLAAGSLNIGGNVTFQTDNTNDIGANGANRPRVIYAGTRFDTGGLSMISTALQMRNGSYIYNGQGTTSSYQIVGDTNVTNGITIYGSGHATKPGYLEFVVNSNTVATATTNGIILPAGASTQMALQIVDARTGLFQPSASALGLSSANGTFSFLNSSNTIGSLNMQASFSNTNANFWDFSVSANTTGTSGTNRLYRFYGTFAPASGTPTNIGAEINSTINWGGTPGAGSYEGLRVVAVETSLPTGTNYLLRLMAGSSGTTEKFSISNGGKALTYNSVATAGWGTPAIYGSGRSTGQTGDVASVATYTCGAADGSFIVSCNANCTAFTAGVMAVQCTYTDETNTSRTLVLSTSNITGTIGTSFAATGAFEGIPLHIRVKASTAITIKTVGTAWTGTYNIEGTINQIA